MTTNAPPIVIVGAPGYNNQLKVQVAGKIYGFEIVKKNNDLSNENKGTKEYLDVSKFDLSGTEEFQGFGK